jgi:ribose/xylose/arabinose/galactoside ABC-type transport system permease subunit
MITVLLIVVQIFALATTLLGVNELGAWVGYPAVSVVWLGLAMFSMLVQGFQFAKSSDEWHLFVGGVLVLLYLALAGIEQSKYATDEVQISETIIANEGVR